MRDKKSDLLINSISVPLNSSTLQRLFCNVGVLTLIFTTNEFSHISIFCIFRSRVASIQSIQSARLSVQSSQLCSPIPPPQASVSTPTWVLKGDPYLLAVLGVGGGGGGQFRRTDTLVFSVRILAASLCGPKHKPNLTINKEIVVCTVIQLEHKNRLINLQN